MDPAFACPGTPEICAPETAVLAATASRPADGPRIPAPDPLLLPGNEAWLPAPLTALAVLCEFPKRLPLAALLAMPGPWSRCPGRLVSPLAARSCAPAGLFAPDIATVPSDGVASRLTVFEPLAEMLATRSPPSNARAERLAPRSDWAGCTPIACAT